MLEMSDAKNKTTVIFLVKNETTNPVKKKTKTAEIFCVAENNKIKRADRKTKK